MRQSSFLGVIFFSLLEQYYLKSFVEAVDYVASPGFDARRELAIVDPR